MKTVAEALLDEIAKTGTEYIFLVPGAHITPLMVKLDEHEKLTPVIANHELAAGFMAIGYARASGKLGVVLSIGGPGAAYMAGAAVAARTDDVPVLFITGDIPAKHHGYGEFQDSSHEGSNDSAIFEEALGESQVCLFSEDLSKTLLKVHQMLTQKKPLHVQIPIDVQSVPYVDNPLASATIDEASGKFTFDFDRGRRTALLIGHEALGKINVRKLTVFANQNSIGVITDLKARGLVPESSDISLGYVGFNSDPRALEALSYESELSVELVIAVGVKPALIKQYVSASCNVININPDNFNNWLNADELVQELDSTRREWLKKLNAKKESLVHEAVKIDEQSRVSYFSVFEQINNIMNEDTYYCLDAGQIRRAGSILLKSHFPGSIIQSDMLSPMGFGICSAIGVKYACPDHAVVSIFGDGSMRMHGLELATAVRYNLPVLFILCDNQSYASILSREGMKEYASLPGINWGLFAESIGMECHYCEKETEFKQHLYDASNKNKPVLLWIRVPDLLDDELMQTHELEYTNWLTEINQKRTR